MKSGVKGFFAGEVWEKVRTYIIAIAISLGVGTLSALLTRGSMDIYGEIETPPLAPPGFLFPIVWAVLYVLMGISSALIWQRREENPTVAKRGLRFYGISLVFNFLWSIIFFNYQSYLAALVWLAALLYFIVRTVIEYKKISPVAAYLEIPYAVWVLFAGYLNFGIFWLNR